MSTPNYKALTVHHLKQFSELTGEEYNFGELLYSILRKVQKPKGVTTAWLREVSDEDFYTALENAIKEEKYEQSTENQQWT